MSPPRFHLSVICAAALLAVQPGCGGDEPDNGADASTNDADGSAADAAGTDADAAGTDADAVGTDADATADSDVSTNDAEPDAAVDPDLPPELEGPVAQVDAPDDASASASLPVVGPFASDVDASGFMPERITAVLAETTVGTLNAALAELGASLASARPGDPIVTLEVAPLADVAAAEAFAADVVATGAFADAFPAFAVAFPLDGAAESGDNKRADGAGIADALENLRIYGAWNADALRINRVRVLVGDLWGQATVPADLSTLTLEAGLIPDLGTTRSGAPRGNHGFWVAGLLGADVNGTGASGTAFDAASQLRIDGFSVANLASFGEINHAIERALRRTSGKVILNLSIGYNDPTFVRDARPRRALFALQWRSILQQRGADLVLVVAAAGNDGQVAGTDASLSSPYATQARIADLSTLVPSDAISQAAWQAVEAQATALRNPRAVVGSTLIVGGAAIGGGRAAFSTPGEDVLAPGETLDGPCVIVGGTCDGTFMVDKGTSGAAPLAAGVAALAWGIAPALSPAELRTMLLSARTGELVDAYQVAIAAAAAARADIYSALADVNDDGALDNADITAALAAWEAAGAEPGGPFRDWSRFDLNGDGFSSTEAAIAIDLDASGAVAGSVLERTVGDEEVAFAESAVTDLHILCIAAYGEAWTGDDDSRDEAIAEACGGSVDPGPGPGFVRIEPGTFTMGSPEGELGRYDDETQHTVTLTRAFLLQATEVTQGEYEALIGFNPSEFTACGASCPVESVSWYDAIAYANAFSVAEGLPACYDARGAVVGGATVYDCVGYRLPTESEWEYAARAGTTTATYLGDLSGNPYSCDPQPSLDSIAWFCGNSFSTPQPVGGKSPNAWGLYDMLGNVWEWTSDWYDAYPGSVTDPVGPSIGSFRVVRGGSWDYYAQFARSAGRSIGSPALRYSNFGFRLARSLP